MAALREFRATARYLQGRGALAELGGMLADAAGEGRGAAVVVDEAVLAMLGSRLVDGLSSDVCIVPFHGEITRASTKALVQSLSGQDIGAVAGVGGGKALDAGKSVARELGVPVICVPTIASTDAPASRGIAIYDDDHKLLEVLQLPANPQVLVDIDVIASAPVRYLRAGIGDALAKKFEAEGALAGGGLNKHGTRPLLSGLIVADGCYQTLRRHAVQAIVDAEAHRATEPLEATVEACFLMSAIGFENTGLSLAHSLTRGLVKTPGVQDALHGFHVAFGTLVQLAIEGRSDAELADLADFLRRCSLPRRLADMDGDATPDTLDRIAELTMTSPHIKNAPVLVTKALIRQGLERVERLSQ
jgi:glycerol dehydrogenase